MRDIPGEREADGGIDGSGEDDLVHRRGCGAQNNLPCGAGGNQPAESCQDALGAEFPRTGWTLADLSDRCVPVHMHAEIV